MKKDCNDNDNGAAFNEDDINNDNEDYSVEAAGPHPEAEDKEGLCR